MKAKLEKIKEHFKSHKKEYIIGTVVVVVTGGVAYAIGRKGYLSSGSGAMFNIRDIKDCDVVSLGTTIIGNGHPGKDLLIMKEGEIIKRCASQNEAADFLETSADTIRRMINGQREHVNEIGRAHV